MKRMTKISVAIVAGFAFSQISHGVTVSEDLAMAPNSGSGVYTNGWNPATNSDTNAPFSGRSNDDGGKFQIFTFGQSNAGVSYSQLNAAPHEDVQWLNAEIIADISRSQAPVAPGTDGLGICIGLQNSNFGYAMGLRAVELDDGVVATTVVIFDQIGGIQPLPTPNPRAVYTIPDTGVNAHRFNAEWDAAGNKLDIYVDGYQGDAPVLSVSSNLLLSVPLTPRLVFGDIRSTGEADGNIYNVRYSDGESLLPDPAASTVGTSTNPVSGIVEVSFETEAGSHYGLQAASGLIGTSVWNAIGPTVVGNGNTTFLYNETGAASERHYRVLQITPDSIGP